MYFPILRSKRFELLAIQATVTEPSYKDTLSPVIEIVTAQDPDSSKATELSRALDNLSEKEIKSFVVLTPRVGDYKDDFRVPLEWYKNLYSNSPYVIPTYVVDSDTTINDARDYFSQSHNSFENLEFGIIHNGMADPSVLQFIEQNYVTKWVDVTDFVEIGKVSDAYCSKLQGRKVRVEDIFKRQMRNADYPFEDYGTDIHLNYRHKEFAGFGDYQMVGDGLMSGGNQPNVVAIHLSFLDEARGKNLYIRHYTSGARVKGGGTVGDENKDMYHDALQKLIADTTANPHLFFMSNGLKGYYFDSASSSRCSLGRIKQYGIMHHIESIAHYLVTGKTV